VSLKRLTVQPRGDVSHLRAEEVLENRIWFFDWYTNAVDDSWMMDIESDGGDVVKGIPAGVALDLLAPYRHLDVPPGVLFVQTQTGRDPRVSDFADGIAVAYYREALS
jgi:hypothetical protein